MFSTVFFFLIFRANYKIPMWWGDEWQGAERILALLLTLAWAGYMLLVTPRWVAILQLHHYSIHGLTALVLHITVCMPFCHFQGQINAAKYCHVCLPQVSTWGSKESSRQISAPYDSQKNHCILQIKWEGDARSVPIHFLLQLHWEL